MSNEVSQRYIDGFTSKCAEYNVDPAALVKYSQATEETEETDTDKYYKRRRRMAVGRVNPDQAGSGYRDYRVGMVRSF